MTCFKGMDSMLKILIAGALAVPGIHAVEPAEAQPVVQGGHDDLRWVIAPYVLAANISGDVGMGRVSGVPVDIDTGDLLAHLEMGGMVHAEVWWRNWGLFTEVVGMRLSDDATATGPLGQTTIDAKIEVTEVVYEVAFAYRLTADRVNADVLAGARIWDLSTRADLSGALVERGISQDETWIDPLIGMRLEWAFTQRWSLIARGDIGGFGVGSDFAWNAAVYLGWQAAHWCTLVAGYRAIGIDYDNDSEGSDAFSYDTITNGAVLGAAFIF